MSEHEEENLEDLDDTVQELLDLNQRLLEAIVAGDWETYDNLCDPTISCFEPEARGHLVEGMDFHKFYFTLNGPPSGATRPPQVTMASPHVRLLGEEAAIICYVRLNQRANASGDPSVGAVEETRVWEKVEGEWKHVHFHRSPAP